LRAPCVKVPSTKPGGRWRAAHHAGPEEPAWARSRCTLGRLYIRAFRLVCDFGRARTDCDSRGRVPCWPLAVGSGTLRRGRFSPRTVQTCSPRTGGPVVARRSSTSIPRGRAKGRWPRASVTVRISVNSGADSARRQRTRKRPCAHAVGGGARRELGSMDLACFNGRRLYAEFPYSLEKWTMQLVQFKPDDRPSNEAVPSLVSRQAGLPPRAGAEAEDGGRDRPRFAVLSGGRPRVRPRTMPHRPRPAKGRHCLSPHHRRRPGHRSSRDGSDARPVAGRSGNPE